MSFSFCLVWINIHTKACVHHSPQIQNLDIPASRWKPNKISHAEEQGESPVHTEYWSESHITDLSKLLSIYSLSLWFDLFTNTASCPWNQCSALAGCWRIIVQPKAHQNQHTDSHGLSGALQWLLNIWPPFSSAAAKQNDGAGLEVAISSHWHELTLVWDQGICQNHCCKLCWWTPGKAS